MSAELTIIIPAAGLGRRMKSYGAKALLPVGGGATLLSRQIQVLRAVFPHAEVVVVVGYQSERVIRKLPPGVRVVENERYLETSVCRSILMGLRISLTPRVLVVYGDLLFTAECLARLPQEDSSLLVNEQLPATEVGCVLDQGLVTHMDYGLPLRWCSVVMLTGKELQLYHRLLVSRDHSHQLGWEPLNDVIDRGGRFVAVSATSPVLKIENANDIALAQELFA